MFLSRTPSIAWRQEKDVSPKKDMRLLSQCSSVHPRKQSRKPSKPPHSMEARCYLGQPSGTLIDPEIQLAMFIAVRKVSFGLIRTIVHAIASVRDSTTQPSCPISSVLNSVFQHALCLCSCNTRSRQSTNQPRSKFCRASRENNVK